MHRKYFIILIILALAAAFFTFASMRETPEIEQQLLQKEAVKPSYIPFKSYISATGIVEPSSENIFIGTPINRVVEGIFVTGGAKVKKGDILFRLEMRDLEANLLTQQLAYQNAVAKLEKLEALPRKEDLISAEAVLKSAGIELGEAKGQYERVQGLQDSRALSLEEIDRRHYNYLLAEAKMNQAEASLEKIRAGAWKPDLEIARTEIQQAKAQLQRIKTEMERNVIRSPINGTVLQVKIHEGEFPPYDASKTPPMIIGNIDKLHLRVSIDQFEAPYFRNDAPAIAYLQGDRKVKFPLKFVEVEPYLVSKQNLTNDITEKVDTRVLQVIYSIEKTDQQVFVGQLMDVFIEKR